MKTIIPNLKEVDEMNMWELDPVPKGWKRIQDWQLDAWSIVAYEYPLLGLMVTTSIDVSRGVRWKHICASMRFLDRLPTWEELSKCKRDFLGDVEAVQVFPKTKDYVNLCKNALHIWAPVEEEHGQPLHGSL